LRQRLDYSSLVVKARRFPGVGVGVGVGFGFGFGGVSNCSILPQHSRNVDLPACEI
jgi:hypothetical protein